MSKIRFTCFKPECKKSYQVPLQFVGKKVKCKKCGTKLKVPPEDQGNSDPSGGSSSSKTSSKSKSPDSDKAKATKSDTSASQSSSRDDTKSSESSSPSPEPTKTSTKIKVKGKSRTGTVIIEVPDISDIRKSYEAKREPDSRERGKGVLVLFKGDKPVKSYRLEGKTCLIGRSSKAQIKIDDETVSKRHCKLEVKLGNFILTDLKSSNGLLVNTKTIRRVSLRNGDIIQLGKAVFRIDCG